MNYGANGQQPSQPNVPHDYMKPPSNLFDDNFLNAAQPNAGPKRVDPQLEKDLNVVQNIFSAQSESVQTPADLSHMSERDRRIYLRDLERKQRNQPGGFGVEQRAYGAEPPPVQNSQPNIFGVQSNVPANDRETRLKQKMEAALNKPPMPTNNFAHLSSSPQIHKEFKPATAFGAQLQQQTQISQEFHQQPQMPSPMRRSLTAQKLQQAKELDVNLNPAMQFQNQANPAQMQFQNHGPLEQMQQAANNYYGQANQPPIRNSPLVKQSFELKQQNMISAIGHNNIDQQRRETNKAQQQQEYNKYLASQAAQKNQRAQSASRQITGDALVQAGMDQIGGHQFRQAEEKAKLQREYQEQLQSQMKQQQQKQMNTSASEWRRKQLSDQVFNELMMESGRGKPPQHMQQQYPVQQQYSELPQIPVGQQQSMQQVNRSAHGIPPRNTSAISSRQDQVQRMQRQSLNDPFHKDRRDENSQKRRELEKKREYGQLLQEQMAAKKSQASQQRQMPQFQQSEQPQFHPPPQQEQLMVDFNQGYAPIQQQIGSQPATGSWQAEESHLYQNAPPQFNQQNPSLPPPSQYQPLQPPSFSNQQFPSHLDKPNGVSSEIQKEKEAQAAERRKIDAYRLELEQQMKEQEEKKRRMKEEQAKYDMANQQDTAGYISQKPQIVTNMQQHPSITSGMINQQQVEFNPAPVQQPQGENQAIRHGTDITRQQQPVDPSKQAARQRYQEELKQQMEEQKAKKEAEKLRQKQQDEEIERKLQQEIAQVNSKEAAEIVKEGKREPPPAERQGRVIRRDQFEPSQENNGIVGGLARAPAQPEEPAPSTIKHDLFTKAEAVTPQSLLPANDNSTFGAHPPINTANEASHDLFGPPPQKLVSLSSPTNNYMPSDAQMPAPQAPQFAQQPPLPSFNQQLQQLQAQQMPQQPMNSTQSEWVTQQQTQANKMFEDQQKMIGLYQQALEQILQYRNQYFEQAMSMRENILKEREQLLEYEKMKQQQIAEMNQLKAVQQQLGSLRENAHMPVLNPQVTNNLNSYINNQKEQILKMSQSSQNMSQIVKQANQMMNLASRQSTISPVNQSQQNESQFQFQEHSQMIPVTREQQEQELPVQSERVDIGPDPRQVNFQPPEDDNLDLQQQVDELAKQIAANETDIVQGQRPLDFEQSLGGHSKMVKVPTNNLAERVNQIQEVSETGDLTETWNEESANNNLAKAGVLSPPRGMAKIMSNSATPVPQSRFGNLGSVPRSPMGSSQVPHTIPELPQEEEKGIAQAKHQQNASGFNFQSENENDMNDRQSEMGGDIFNQQRPSDEVEANLEKIERLVNKTQSGFTDRKATITGSSFYERTMQAQKVQEQNQQEEMQKQLARILGGTAVSESQNQETDSPNVLAPLQEQFGPGSQANQGLSHHSSVKVRASQEMLVKPTYEIPEDSKESTRPVDQQNLTIENTSEINIANTQTSIALQQVQIDKFNNPSRMHEIQDQSVIKPIETSRMEEEKQQLENEALMLQVKERQSQVIESKRTFQPDVVSQSASRASKQGPPIEEEQAKEQSVWDDPEMVSVPVLPTFTDNSISYDAHEGTSQAHTLKEEPYVSPVPDESHQRNRNNASSIMNTDGTIAGLQRLVPDIIKTEEFELNHVSNTTSGEQQLEIKPVGNRRIWQQPMDESQPDFEHQQSPQHVTIDKSPPRVQQSKSRSPKRSPRPEMEATVTTQLSKKEQEMLEIEALIRKATNTVNIANERETERKKSMHLKKNSPEQEVSQTPRDQPQQNFLPGQPSQFVQQHLKTDHPAVGQSNLETMQLAANPSQPSLNEQKLGVSNSNNDQQILADLDKIISNLEKQQKNMQTFGIPKLTEADDDEEEEEDLDKEPRPVTATPDGMRPPDMTAGAEEAKPKTSVTSSDMPVQSESRWTSLQAARDAQKTSPRPPTGKSGKAPLPLAKPKSGLENKSKITNTSRCDASPQRLGKYAQMALQGGDQANESKSKISNTSRCDASPQRIGKYAQMAIQNNDAANTSKISARVSPQHVGKYAQMAMQSNTEGGLRQPSPLQKRLNLSRSPQSVGKYAQMAMQNNPPNQEMKSPQKMGKFAQMAMQNGETPSEQVLDNISQKYGRNPSRERLDRSNISGDGRAGMNASYYTNNQQEGQPNKILRPVSGKSSSSRYGGKSPGGVPNAMGQIPRTGQTVQRPLTDLGQEAIQDHGARVGSTMTPGTQKALGKGRLGNNVAYCSDEDEVEDQQMQRQTRDAFAPPYHQTLHSQASGMTELTQQNKQVGQNINEH